MHKSRYKKYFSGCLLVFLMTSFFCPVGFSLSSDINYLNENEFDEWEINFRVILEGPYSGNGIMQTALLHEGNIPLNQPYNAPPWYYDGEENCNTFPENVVDWVLLEFRDAEKAENADVHTIVKRKAALLRSDGKIIGSDGFLPRIRLPAAKFEYFIAVYHRNHLGIISKNYVEVDDLNKIFSYDFTQHASSVFGELIGFKQLDDSIFGMIAADANGDGFVALCDYEILLERFGSSEYDSADFGLNANISFLDLELFINNIGRNTQIP